GDDKDDLHRRRRPLDQSLARGRVKTSAEIRAAQVGLPIRGSGAEADRLQPERTDLRGDPLAVERGVDGIARARMRELEIEVGRGRQRRAAAAEADPRRRRPSQYWPG